MRRSVLTKFASLTVVVAGAFVPSARAYADIVSTRCNADAVNAAVARLRLEWARACGTKVNVISPTAPTPPALSYDTGLTSSNGGIPLWEYIETDDF